MATSTLEIQKMPLEHKNVSTCAEMEGLAKTRPASPPLYEGCYHIRHQPPHQRQ